MGKTEKLIDKLKRGKISADELRTLLRRLGWVLDGQTGSHEQWHHAERVFPKNRITLSPHGKDLLPYQIKLARIAALDEE